MTIALVGMPGSGKSTVGRQLARQLELAFVDSDHVVERRLGMPIRDWFAQHGEEAFRDAEQAVIDELSQQDGAVLATGGGAVLRPSNGCGTTPSGRCCRWTIRSSACASSTATATRCTGALPTSWLKRRGPRCTR